tara:strand:+ start:486 stop:698 length:213 start_codon:yes stop_codon:yes gene_type:complete
LISILSQYILILTYDVTDALLIFSASYRVSSVGAIVALTNLLLELLPKSATLSLRHILKTPLNVTQTTLL